MKLITLDFERHYIPEPNSGCWIWLGALTRGYGRIKAMGRDRLAHVVSYELHRGPVPSGLELDHLCRIPCCVNPDHLEAVTHKENVARGMHRSAIAVRTNKCQNGHDITYRRPNGTRYCSVCEAIRQRERRACR